MATLATLSGAAPERPAPALATTSVALVSVVLVGISRSTSTPMPATTPLVLVAAAAAGAVLLRATYGLSRNGGWTTLRRLLVAITVVAVAYPGLFAAAAIASRHAPNTTVTWALATLAGSAHLPVIATFSLVPLFTVRYLGRGSGRAAVIAVGALGCAAAASFALFFGDFHPLSASALVPSPLGERIGMALNLAFLSTVLLGPAAALLATWRSKAEGSAARRLALVAGSALTGTALVMVCGAVGSASTLGQGVVLLGMYAALALVVTGCVAALRTEPVGPPARVTPDPAEPASSARSQEVAGLTPREREVLQLLAEGLSNAGIAARLVLSERTVDAHLRSVFTKLDLPQSPEHNRRVHAVRAWQRAVGHPHGATHHVERRS